MDTPSPDIFITGIFFSSLPCASKMEVGVACEAVFAVVAVVPVEGATVGTACGLAMTGVCGRGTAE